jgi:hypothetical protein
MKDYRKNYHSKVLSEKEIKIARLKGQILAYETILSELKLKLKELEGEKEK